MREAELQHLVDTRTQRPEAPDDNVAAAVDAVVEMP